MKVIPTGAGDPAAWFRQIAVSIDLNIKKNHRTFVNTPMKPRFSGDSGGRNECW
jgi:hypothetical protein